MANPAKLASRKAKSGRSSPAAPTRPRNAAVLSLLILVLTAPRFAFAEKSPVPVEPLGGIIVLEEGRKKPLDTYARNKLLQFSGKTRIHGSSALAWLARVMFDSQAADTEAVFLINNPEIAQALGITPRPGRRYSFMELYQANEKLNEQYQSANKTSQKERTSFENEILRLRGNFFEYGSLSSTFSFFNPFDEFTIKDSILAHQLDFEREKALSYVELLTHGEILSDKMLELRRKGIENLAESDKALMNLVNRMYQFSSSIHNPPPHCMVMLGDQGEIWVSPWGFIAQRQTEALADKSMRFLLKIRSAYLNKDPKQFMQMVGEFKKAVRESASSEKAPDPSLELIYNAVGPFVKSKIALGLASLLALVAVFSATAAVYWSGMALVGVGWVLISFGIFLRMVIMGHPPLSNLYETFVFVAWLTIIIGVVLEFLRLRPIGLITASMTGFIFLHLAGKYAGDGDTMGTLIAVLNSSFWLTTHIITIALGFAGCVAAGVVGHVYLIQAMIKKSGQSKIQAVERAVYGILCFGLLFTVVGTIFGGLWADQAWGRFWGWDPKENGSLLIIIWCLLILHARSDGIIKGAGTAIGAIISAILVMCTWVGVNLLGVGLHSYGFTSSGVASLLTYIGVEIAFLATTGILIKFRSPSV